MKSWESCQVVRKSPVPAILHLWLWPAKLWQCIHFVALDVHSKWAEVNEMPSITAQQTIVEVYQLFTTFGLAEQVVTDNGPTFVAKEFQIFFK